MSASVTIVLDTTAPLIEFGSVSVNSSLIMSLPYEVSEAATIAARLITTGGEIIGNVFSDHFEFNISAVGVTAVQAVIVDLIDDVLNERQVTKPLVLRDFSRVLSFSVLEQPTVEVSDKIVDPVLSSIAQVDPVIKESYSTDSGLGISDDIEVN
jgi:hypothetical protein